MLLTPLNISWLNKVLSIISKRLLKKIYVLFLVNQNFREYKGILI